MFYSKNSMNSGSDTALIIFAKNPVKGKVKTRIAAKAGEEKALEAYTRLLNLTYENTKNTSAGKYLFLTENLDSKLFDKGYIQKLQQGNTLGERMSNAFSLIFSLDYNKAVIIGTDLPGLTIDILNEAYKKLNDFDFVIGPSQDGGYYLLGMKYLEPEIFKGVQWSTSSVLDETIKHIKKLDKSYYLLTPLPDVDEAEDLHLLNL